MTDINEKIDQRKSILVTIKAELIHRLNIQREEHQIDDDTPLFGNGLESWTLLMRRRLSSCLIRLLTFKCKKGMIHHI